MTLRSNTLAARMLLAVSPLLIAVILTIPQLAWGQPAQARPVSSKASPADVTKPDQAEQRIADLRAKLGITPDQELAWTNLAQVMRDNAGKMKLLLDKWAQGSSSMTAVESLKIHEEMALEHAQALRRLIPAFETLYAMMPPDQKAAADKVFATHEARPRHKRR